MKKLMVLVLSLAMLISVLGVAAAEVVDITDSDNNKVFDLSNYSEGTLIVTIVFTEEAEAKGVNEYWGVGKVSENVDGWPAVEGFDDIKPTGAAVAGETFTVKYDVAALKAVNAGVINVYNGCEVVKIEVETSGSSTETPSTETPSTETPSTEDTPQTGDAMSIVLLAGVAVVALGAVVAAKKARA